jgi:carbamate kinase
VRGLRALDEIPRRLLVAIGGNATHPENIEGTSEEQKAEQRGRALHWLMAEGAGRGWRHVVPSP